MIAAVVVDPPAGAAGYWVLAPSVDALRALGPMEAATPGPAVGDRVLIAARLDVAGTWVIVATLPPA